MKDELLLKVYNWVATTAEQIGDWSSKEVPLFIVEFLQWRFWESMVGIIQYGAAVLIGIAVATFIYRFGFKTCVKLHDANPREDWEVGIITIPLLSIPVAIGLLCANFPTENIKTCVQIKVAPKVYLVEEAVKIVSNVK